MSMIRLSKVLPRAVARALRKLRGVWRGFGYASPKRTASAVGEVTPDWRSRIDEAIACPDNAFIPRVPDAGKLQRGFVIMHNGLRVSGLGYYGSGNMNLLLENRGVHEPQEERAFSEVLRHVPPSGAMLELGAYWGFYSLWFAHEVPGARSFLVEPEPENLKSGMLNFRENGHDAVFENAYVGARPGIAHNGTKVVSVDDFCQRHHIDQLAILHADIQGFEVEMLEGASRMLSNKKIMYIFISTHSTPLHRACIDLLRASGFVILASADLDDTFSIDGLIVAKRADLELPRTLAISHKSDALAGSRHSQVGDER
jgi:hypothetical protein